MPLFDRSELVYESYNNFNIRDLKGCDLAITHDFIARVMGLVSTPAKNTKDDWLEEANCRGVNLEVMYPIDSKGGEEAKQYCNSCEVRADCLAAAIKNEENHGVWGGLNEHQRNLLVRKINRSIV